MRRSMAYSAALHLAVIAIVLIGLPHFIRDLPEDTPIPVEIVTIADKTTARPQERPPEPPRPKPPEPPQQAKPAPKPPTPTPPQPSPPQQQAKAEPTPAPEKVPEPDAEPIPDPKKKEPAKAPEPPKPQQRFADAKPQKKPQPTRDDFVANLLKDVAPKKTASDTPTPTPAKTPSPPPPAPPKAQAIDEQLTMSEIDAIRRQYIECWNPPAGARDARDLVVSIHVEFNPDGSVRRAEYADMSRMGDPFYRTAAESALRAVLNPRCNPLKDLPAKKYDVWRSVTINFNPRDMLG
ncbi:MAG: energy transducer TonB [Gemmatimonas sp.]